MAEVLPHYSQPAGTITMLHSRPSSSDAFQGSQQQYSPSPPSSSRVTQAPRSMYNGQQQNATGYRGAPSPVQPYAFHSTPHLRQDSRSSSTSATTHGPVTGLRHQHTPSASGSTTSSEASSQPSARDDSVMGSTKSLSGINLGWQLPDMPLPSFEQPVKASPERYRRPPQKRVESGQTPPKSATATQESEKAPSLPRSESVDDLAIPRTGQAELAKRYRRRSLNQLETAAPLNPPAPQISGGNAPTASAAIATHGATSTPTTMHPAPFQPEVKTNTPEVLPQSQVSPSPRPVDSARPAVKPQEVKRPSTAPTTEPKTVSAPTRGPPEPIKRSAGPSPLSRQANDPERPSSSASPTKPKTYAAAAQSALQPPSAAAAQLAAVSDRDLNKGMKSRLRRAFSFGGAQELRRAAGENNQAAANQAQQTRQQHQQNIDDELDAEQLEIARRQEEAGIGAGIYSGQGGFAGSTDNLSISSTASSASMMLRKMGRGAKKGAKSIKGLFRPKSVIGVPAADGPLAGAALTPGLAEVSRVTVEAERQNVNVNAHADELVGGGTGFPKLERNSLDAASAARGHMTHGSMDGSDSHSRRSIVGSDKDRAEVLAAVKKGILKRSGTASPSGSPVIRPADGTTPQFVESPAAANSIPGTPREQPQRRSVSMTNTPGDYFGARGLAGMAKSMPNTPNGSMRNISFSPRIQFHDVWSSTEYDRRGGLATCNHLTPLLAQQIKEELNTFKMEMEVHELSKPHTHFF